TMSLQDTHAETVRLDTPELVRRLISHLGTTAVATLAGVRDRTLPNKWKRADGPTPRLEALRRLQDAHRAWVLIATAESDHTARAWFIGSNPMLDEDAPLIALRDDRRKEVLAAAQAFVAGTAD